MYDTVGICLTCEGVFLGLTKSPSTFPGMHTFISEDLAETMTALSESLLRNTWQPSVLSMDTVGH